MSFEFWIIGKADFEFWVLNFEFWIVGKADFEFLNFEFWFVYFDFDLGILNSKLNNS